MRTIEKFKFCPVCGSSHFAANSEKSLKCEACDFEYFVNAAAAYVAFILDDRHRLLVERRGREPAKGTLDLPGGFADAGETAEHGLRREVMEETGMPVVSAKYMFSRPNTYRYSGIDIPTLDLFFLCATASDAVPHAADDAAECFWVPIDELHIEQFGLGSVRDGLRRFVEMTRNGLIRLDNHADNATPTTDNQY